MDDATIKILEKRVKVFKKLIAVEQKAINRLKYKSRAIRHGNTSTVRMNWYTDRMQELTLTIQFLKGGVNEKSYIHYLLDDKCGELLTFIGNGAKVNN
jgi:hypothetical protein